MQAVDKNTKLTLLLISTLTVMAGAIITPALPDIANAFDERKNAEFLAKLILTFPALFIAITAPFAGYITDKIGRKSLLLIAMVFYAAAGTSGLYLNTIEWLLFSRVCLGISVGAITTVVTTLVGDYFEGDEREKFMGLQSGAMALGGMCFLALGGFLAEITWRAPFLLYFASLLVLPLAWLTLEESGGKKAREQLPKEKYPASTIFTIYLTAFASMIFFYMLIVQVPFLMEKMGIGGLKIGASLACSTLFAGITAVLYPYFRKYFNYPTLYFFAFMPMGLGFGLIGMASSFIEILIGLMVAGLGLGVMLPTTNLWLIAVAPERNRGSFVGGLNTAIFLGQFSSPYYAQPLIVLTGTSSTFFITASLMWVIAIFYIVLGVRIPQEAREIELFIGKPNSDEDF